MDLKTFTRAAKTFARYQTDNPVHYLAVGLEGEIGELWGCYKKKIGFDDPHFTAKMKDEIGDVLWYLALLADEKGIEITSDWFVSCDPPPEENIATVYADLFKIRVKMGYVLGGTITLHELGWIYAYLSDIALILRFTVEEAMEANIDKLTKRLAENQLIYHANATHS